MSGFFIFSGTALTATIVVSPISIGNFDYWGVNSGTKIDAVSANDGDVTYIHEDSDNKRQTFGVASAGVPIGATINSVTIEAVARKDESGAKLKLRVEKGTASADVDDGPSINLDADYTSYTRSMTTNPFTGATWTVDEVNNWLNSGDAKAIKFGVANNASKRARVTKIAIKVDYSLPATIPFTETFGTGSTSSDIPDWSKNGNSEARAATGSGNDSASPDGGRFALVDGNGGWICRGVDATGFDSLQLSYYWRGDNDAESTSDYGIVEYKVGGSCGDASGWNQLQNHDLSLDTSWTTQPAFSLSGANNFLFFLRFRAASNQTNEDFRIDGVAVSGSLIDTTPPTLSEITPVPTLTNDNTPDYTFNSSEAGNITYDGDCTSATTDAIAGDNTVTFDELEDDTYSDCTITVTDEADNPSDPLNVSAFTVDTTAPTVSVDPLVTNNSTPLVTGDTSDNFASFDVVVNGINYSGFSYSAGEWAVNVTDILPDGIYDVSVTATDAAGNSGSDETIDELTIDTTSPTLTLNAPLASDPTNTSPIYFTATFNEDVTDFDFTDLQLINASLDSFTPIDGAHYEFNLIPTAEGMVSVEVATDAAQDAAGNPSDYASFSIEYASTPPSVLITSPEADGFYFTTDNPSFSFVASPSPTSGQEITAVDCALDDDLYESFVSCDSFTSHMLSEVSEGAHTFYVRSTDAAENWSVADREFFVDTIAPTASITSPVADSYLRGMITITADASDDDDDEGSGIQKVEFWYASIGTKIGEDTSAPYSIDWDTTSVVDGEHNLWVVAYDNAGNYTISEPAVSVIVDNTPPIITLNGDNPMNLIVNNDTYEEPGAEAVDNIDERVEVIISGDIVNTSVVGTYYVTYDATDTAGNPAEQIIRTVNVNEESAPEISNQATSAPTDTSMTVTWTTDNPATSRVIYDTVSHASLGSGNCPSPNDAFECYGYAYSTGETDTDLPLSITTHSVVVSGLTPGTTYYFRTVSHGSPESVSGEFSATTTGGAPTPTPTGGVATLGGGILTYTPAPAAAPTAPTGQVLGAAIFNFTFDLKFGMKGDAVTELQKRLTAEGVYSGPITGYFGSLTLAGVKAYQAKYGIPQTGIVGPLTRAQLNGSQVAGASAIDLQAIQTQIASLQAQVANLFQQLQQMLQSQGNQ